MNICEICKNKFDYDYPEDKLIQGNLCFECWENNIYSRNKVNQVERINAEIIDYNYGLIKEAN